MGLPSYTVSPLMITYHLCLPWNQMWIIPTVRKCPETSQKLLTVNSPIHSSSSKKAPIHTWQVFLPVLQLGGGSLTEYKTFNFSLTSKKSHKTEKRELVYLFIIPHSLCSTHIPPKHLFYLRAPQAGKEVICLKSQNTAREPGTDPKSPDSQFNALPTDTLLPL